MAYVIKYLKDGQSVGQIPHGGPLEKAMQQALEQFPISKTVHGATTVIILDDNAKVVFTYADAPST